MKNEINNFSIKMKNGYFINVEVYDDGENKQSTIGILNADGDYMQDVCMVREIEGDGNNDKSRVECLVWDDECDENYRHSFVIPVYDGE